MKMTFLIASCMVLNLSSPVYNITCTKLQGGNLQLSSLQEKKIIVVAFNAKAADNSILNYLDSLQSASDSIKVIAVPALDFDGTADSAVVKRLADSMQLGIVITKPAYVKKSASNQYPLLSWLTHSSDNTHFNKDAEDGQLYFISKKGSLYAVLGKTASKNTLAKVINQSPKE